VLKTDVAYIPANLSSVAVYKKMEKTANFLSATLREINDIQDKLHKIKGLEADAPKQKVVCEISCVLEKT
jgi:hypothetical protein